MALPGLNSASRWTRSKIELPRKPPTRLTDFDDHDVTSTVTPKDARNSVQALEGRVPNYLLLVSLLEHLCSLYENDPEKSQQIFSVLCQQLAKMEVMPSFSFLEEFSVIRAKYKKAFSDLMQAAVQEIGTDFEGIQHPHPDRPISSFTGNLQFGSSKRSFGKMRDLLPGGTSRYKDEFVEMGRLGKGGFGSVLKVKNKLDGREYAVKKVLLKETDPGLCLKILREVKVLARLNHVNVVGYHSAWLEYVTTQNSSALPRVATQPVSLKELDEISSISGAYRVGETSHSNSIIFENSSQSGRDASNSSIIFSVGEEDGFTARRQSTPVDSLRMRKIPSTSFLKNSISSSRNSIAPYPYSQSGTKGYQSSQSGVRKSASSNSLVSLSGNDKSESPSTQVARKKTLGMMLFIQMQLCTTTLCDWLQSRNFKGGNVDTVASMAIFRQIVEGVRYIHSQGLMHRDLKPRNIFLQSLTRRDEQTTAPLQVKIGDFGLARKDAVLYPDTSSPLASLIEPLSHHNPFLPGLSTKDAPTCGVGTCTYAAPEQLRNTDYANKADMYSLGIILFELYWPFGTEMERVTSIKNLRQGNLPKAFSHRWPAEVSQQLSEQLEMQSKEIDELKNVIIEKDLELEAQGSENEKLQQELAERNELIRRLMTRRPCHACGQGIDMEGDWDGC
ncbi:predicted protein [Nematostella vectensis]|uniref:Eukaryotic translation initiation factor 2-alpha kinase 1 n=1 Tax=Nematostella vectensis TaxID=45351 RepID=A7RQ17_NEMVE|nr:predicted protein [Nematostella vectensis]|eukprot:XP_001638479.1 predicted protein [Nematostella vectensis]